MCLCSKNCGGGECEQRGGWDGEREKSRGVRELSVDHWFGSLEFFEDVVSSMDTMVIGAKNCG